MTPKMYLAAFVTVTICAAVSFSSMAHSQPQRQGPSTYTVQQGDTLWGIVIREYPGDDPRDIIQQIKRMNGISDSETLYVGTVLRLP